MHYRTCNLCEAMCGIAIEVTADGEIGKIRGDEQDPFSRGHICPKAVALKDVHEDPDRLKRPLKRQGDDFVEVGWDEAFDDVAKRITEIQKAHGRRAVGLYQGNPTVHSLGGMTWGPVFARALKTPNKFSATSLDQLPHMLAALQMFGHQLMIPIPDVDRTDHFLILGGNPVVSNGSLMTAPGIERRLKDLAKRGRLVVVDPRRSETAALADRHVAIRPGTDAYLLLAMLHVVLGERGAKLGRLEPFTVGLADVEKIAAAWPPERVAALVGIDAGVIRELALDFADAKSAVAYGRVGLCTQAYGGLAAWLVNVLNIVTGNLDRVGGGMFTTPAVDALGAERWVGLRGSYDRRRTRVRDLPEFGGEFPAVTLAEEIETPGEGQIRALVTTAGNPVLSSANGRRLDRALAQLDFMVSIDIYVNETTRHADYILPPTFALERDHYDLAFHVLAIRNTAKFSEPLFEKSDDQRHDWEIFRELAWRLEPKPAGRFAKKLAYRRMSAADIVAIGLRAGPHDVTLAALKAHPHGVDLGALEPRLPERLFTRDKRIDLVPKIYLDDLPRLEADLETPRNGSLSLIGRRELRTCNSWMHNSHRLVKGKERCTLRMHPDDAAARGLESGARVTVASAVGEIEAPLEITDEMRPGVVSLPHGWGHDRDGIRLRVATEHAGVSINDITDDGLTDPLSGTVQFSDVPVTVTATSTKEQ